uniref:Uncharacterized protein n=1 Tax=Periophthalmus magnuspinnatus TaxID=409849 RepID=A0A3B4B9H3_9GOBI
AYILPWNFWNLFVSFLELIILFASFPRQAIASNIYTDTTHCLTNTPGPLQISLEGSFLLFIHLFYLFPWQQRTGLRKSGSSKRQGIKENHCGTKVRQRGADTETQAIKQASWLSLFFCRVSPGAHGSRYLRDTL